MTSGESKKLLLSRLDRATDLIRKDHEPARDRRHEFERTGWFLLRCALALIEGGDKAKTVATDRVARGYSSGTGGEPVSGSGGELTSVEAAASQTDEWEREVIQLDLERRLLDDNARSIESRIYRILLVRPNEGRVSTLIDCANPRCDHTMTGFGDDRPRGGRCPRCATHRYRFPGFEWPNKPGAAHLYEDEQRYA